MMTWLRDKILGNPDVKLKEPIAAVEIAPAPVTPQITDAVTVDKPKRKYTKKKKV